MGEPIIKRVNEFDPILGTEIEDTDLLYVVKPTATLPADIDRKLTAAELIEYLNTKVSGGGGSGSGLDTLAVANELERTTGASVSLPNDKVNRDVFQNDDPVFCYLRESYVNTQGNIIKFDHGLLSEIKIIDDMNATTGWTGTNCVVGVSPSIKVEGTNSVTMTLSSFSGTAYITKTFTAFYLNDLLMALSMRIGNIANLNDVSRLSVYLESSTNYSSEFYFDRASLGYVVDNFYRFTAPLNQTPDVVGSSGAAVLGSITKVQVKITTTNAISPIVYVDFITAISDKSFVAPTYSQTISIADGVNQESFTVISENTTSNITKGTFTFEGLTQRLYFDIDFVTNNVISLRINGVAMTPVPFDTDNSTTYTNLATQILTEFPDTILGATADPSNRQIILTAKDNGVKMVVSNISVIGGGVQATGQTQFCLANDYTNDSTVTYLSSNTGEASGGEFKQKTTVTGDNLKNAKYHSVVYAGKMLEKATFEGFLNFNDDIFEVSDLSNLTTTGEITLKQVGTSASDVLRFKDKENFILFKDVRVGKLQQSPRGTALSNFYVCKQSADGTNSGAYLTVTTDRYLTNYLTGKFTVGVPDLGADLSDYRVVPESVIKQLIASTKLGSTCKRLFPKDFFTKKIDFNFNDGFNYGSDVYPVPIDKWNSVYEVGGTPGSGTANVNLKIINDMLYTQAGASWNNRKSRVYIPVPFKGPIEYPVTMEFLYYHQGNYSYSWYLNCFVGFGHNGSASMANDSIGFWFEDHTGSIAGTSRASGFIRKKGTDILTLGSAWKQGNINNYKIKFKITRKKIQIKKWLSTVAEPSNYSDEISGDFTFDGRSIVIATNLQGASGGSDWCAALFDNFKFSCGNNVWSLSFKEDGIVNFDKLETITTNHRVDAVNQFPAILQKAEQVY